RDRSPWPHRRSGRRRHADLLDRPAVDLRFLLHAGRRAPAAWPARRGNRTAAGDHRPLCRRQPAHRQLEGAGLGPAPAHAAGNYALAALMTKDSGPSQSSVLFVALLYVLVNFVIDILYGLIDPRIRLE